VTAPNFLDGTQLCASPTVDKEDWFPGRGEDGIAATVRAKTVCARCPLREPCLAYALPYASLQGIWGGSTVNERAEMRKRQGTESQPLLPPGFGPRQLRPEAEAPRGRPAVRNGPGLLGASPPEGNDVHHMPGGAGCRTSSASRRKEDGIVTDPKPSSLSVREVSDQLGVSRMTIYRLIDSGDLTAYRIGRSIRVWPADVNRYLRGARIWQP
jgi:WhiB family redox-sensing transcriptional regulator